MAETSPSVDCLIVGAGITGRSLYWHLRQRGYKRLLVIDEEAAPSSSQLASGYVLPGCWDNMTRLTHARGDEVARKVWQVGQDAARSLTRFIGEQGLSPLAGERWRFAVSAGEWEELQQAVSQIQRLGFAADIWAPRALASRFPAAAADIAGAQQEGEGSSWLAPAELMSALPLAGSHFKRDRVQQIDVEADGVQVTGRKSSYRCELVVIAAHLGVAPLTHLPAETLVPFADQWHDCEVADWGALAPLPLGSFISFQHGHLWGVKVSPDRLLVGGARFLRPLAGIGASQSEYSKKIERFLCERWASLWPGLQLKVVKGRALEGLQPCDEMPIIGPMFGEPRVLVATGFANQGLSLGFWAGEQLAALIDAGEAPQLPRMFWPERLRSWET
jgi:glycine/D-amino acid oxidase-like deaminating enzyme